MSGRLYDDGVIDPRDTRTVLGLCLSAIHSGPVDEGAALRRLPDVRDDDSIDCWWPTGARSPAGSSPPAGPGHRDGRRHSDADADAPHVAEADTPYGCPGNAPAETYLRATSLIDAARAAGADAVHPGYGFLSENADFAAAVIDAGLTWVGPPPKAIAAMGSKTGGEGAAGRAGVPMLPSWTEPDRGHRPSRCW